MSGQGTLAISALGRPFSLGSLYDRRNDKLLTAVSLWDKEVLRKECNMTAQNSIDYKVNDAGQPLQMSLYQRQCGQMLMI